MFVPYDVALIERSLAVSTSPWDVRVVRETGSTNADLLRDVRAGSRSPAPRLLVAEVQHAGRGRHGRSWFSAPGQSITASFALPIARSLADLDGVTLACGLAVQRVVATHGVAARLKWPNDLLVDGRKLAGILVEAHALPGAAILVVGVGLNVSVESSSTFASLCTGDVPPVDRNRLVAELAEALRADIATFERDGFAAFAARWNAEDAYRGRTVTVGATGGPTATGIARGVDGRGALLLEVDGVLTTIVAGDVSLRPAARSGKREAA